jgi:hypothetical protein
MIRIPTYVAVCMVLLLAGCATAPPHPSEREMLTNLQKDFTAVRLTGDVFATNYKSGLRWSEQAARYGYLYWNARLTVESGRRYFLVKNEQIRAQPFPAGVGMTTRGGSTFRASGTFAVTDLSYDLKGTVRMFADRPPIRGAIDAQEFLRGAKHPSKHTRLKAGAAGNAT